MKGGGVLLPPFPHPTPSRFSYVPGRAAVHQSNVVAASKKRSRIFKVVAQSAVVRAKLRLRRYGV